MKPRVAVPIAFAGFVVACAANPVPVGGAPDEVAQLAGEWEGSYTSAATGRSGLIHFDLRAGSDTAFGEVLMIPRSPERVRAVDEPMDVHQSPRMAEMLTIRFVRVSEGRISGEIALYRDPECGCRVLTTFDGALEGNRISGTFVSRHVESGAVRRGDWNVERKK